MLRPKLFQVFPTNDYAVYLFYDNGEIKVYDCNWILKKSGVFTKLHDVERFKQLCTIMNGTLAWDISECRDPYNCIDICPDTIYQESMKTHIDPLRTPA